MNKKLLAASLLALSTTLATNVHAQTEGLTQEGTVLEVNGEGLVKVLPNEVVLNFNVSDTQKDAKVARDNVEKVVREFSKNVSVAGIDDKKFVADNLYINPQYTYVKNERKFEGYNARRDVKVTLDDFTLISKVTDLALKSGINGVSGIQYSVSNSKTYNNKALELAVADAKDKANQIAKGFEMKVFGVKKVVLVDEGRPSVMYRVATPMLGAKANDADSVYSQEDIEIKQRVVVEFILK